MMGKILATATARTPEAASPIHQARKAELCLGLALLLGCAVLQMGSVPQNDGSGRKGGPTGQAADVQEQLIDLEKQSWVAWKARDGKFFEHFLTPDHVEVGASGLANKQTVVAFVGSPVCTVKSYSLDKFVTTRISDDVVLLNYLATQDAACNGKQVTSPAWASSLYVRRNGEWGNVLYQHSALQ